MGSKVCLLRWDFFFCFLFFSKIIKAWIPIIMRHILFWFFCFLLNFFFSSLFIYWILHLLAWRWLKYFRLLYLDKKSNCLALMAPLRLLRIASTASSYFMPNSIRAIATSTGALPRPVTQCTPTQVSGFSVNSALTTFSHLSTISWLGGEPSEKIRMEQYFRNIPCFMMRYEYVYKLIHSRCNRFEA